MFDRHMILVGKARGVAKVNGTAVFDSARSTRGCMYAYHICGLHACSGTIRVHGVHRKRVVLAVAHAAALDQRGERELRLYIRVMSDRCTYDKNEGSQCLRG